MDEQYAEKIYVVYETGEFIWNKAYRTFELALFAVVERINLENQIYTTTPAYEIRPQLPARMEDEYNKKDASAGLLVANINDYEVKICIKEIDLSH